MKKALIILMVVVLLLSVVGCSTNSPNKIGALGSNQMGGSSGTTEAATTAMQSKSQEAPDDTSCRIYPMFYSIEDLDRYVTTGSLNLEDYKYAPDTPLDKIFSPELLRSQRYSSIYRFFDFEEDIFDSVEVEVKQGEDGRFSYCYYLDDVCILIRYVGTKATTLSAYAEHQKISITADSSATLHPDTLVDNGYKTAKCGEFDIVYTMKDGAKRAVSIVIDGLYIAVRPCVEVSAYFDTEEQVYADFMTSPKYAAFSPLFSDDQETFEAAVMGMVQPKAEVE